MAKLQGASPAAVSAAKGQPIATDIDCSECGHPMTIRFSRRGPFLGCSHYPKCKNTAEVPAKLLEELSLDGGEKTAEAKPMPDETEHGHDVGPTDLSL